MSQAHSPLRLSTRLAFPGNPPKKLAGKGGAREKEAFERCCGALRSVSPPTGSPPHADGNKQRRSLSGRSSTEDVLSEKNLSPFFLLKSHGHGALCTKGAVALPQRSTQEEGAEGAVSLTTASLFFL